MSLQSVVMVAGVALSAPTTAQANLGTWLNTDKKGKIALSECGENSLCGKIVWLKDPMDEKGQPWRDILNPDPKLRGRQVVGIDVLLNTKKIGPNTWQGQIYDPEVGKVYYLKHLKLQENKVEVRGCLSSGWPCRTKYWTRSQPVSRPAPSMQVAKKAPAKPTPPPAPRVAPPAPVPPPVAAARPAPAQPQLQARAPQPRVQQRPQPRPQARPPAPPRPAVAPPRAPNVTASIPRTGGYLVQVAARQSQNEALRAFNSLQRRYPQLLGGLRPEVMRADLGQRGVWYRVGIGPMAQQSAAVNFCQRLKSAGADCLIRRR
ncbi:MAG: DUF2147 domain-containing protein [Hyphomicrobiaceae bacterium]|nr:DUF2147 domain-containing protein [Hyphomicrobiaceae bacterium]